MIFSLSKTYLSWSQNLKCLSITWWRWNWLAWCVLWAKSFEAEKTCACVFWDLHFSTCQHTWTCLHQQWAFGQLHPGRKWWDRSLPPSQVAIRWSARFHWVVVWAKTWATSFLKQSTSSTIIHQSESIARESKRSSQCRTVAPICLRELFPSMETRAKNSKSGSSWSL